MIKYKVTRALAAAALALLVLSCSADGGGGGGLGTKTFHAQNMRDNTFYSLTADLLVIGSHCTVWVEQGGAGADTAQAMADAFDTDIYPKMLSAFSFNADISYGGKIVARDAVEFADFLGDGDGKLAILLLDIRDDYAPGGSYVAGYFSWINFYANNDPAFDFDYKSNLMDMIYVDVSPGKPGSKESNATVAHEMQHMMNYVTSVVYRVSGGKYYQMDTWVDEGLSSAAEYIYLGAHNAERYKWFTNNGVEGGPVKGEIDKGNNFFVWGNIKNDNKLSVMDDYATVYLFFQWLRLQSGGTNAIYKEIITSPYYDYRAVTSEANKAMSGKGYSDWPTLLKTWMAANYINASTGPYGYMDDPVLKTVKVTGAPTDSGSLLSLAQGEGVYSGISGSPSVTPTSIIKYAGLNKGAGTVNSSPGAGDTVLLTYNVNFALTYNDGEPVPEPETGTVTMTPVAALAAADISISPSASVSRSAGGGAGFAGPFRIDARDALARNGHGTGAFMPLAGRELPAEPEPDPQTPDAP